MAPLTLIHLLGGWIADNLFYPILFGLATALALSANAFSAVGLREPRARA